MKTIAIIIVFVVLIIIACGPRYFAVRQMKQDVQEIQKNIKGIHEDDQKLREEFKKPSKPE
jgi:uncharacterized protein YxeA